MGHRLSVMATLGQLQVSESWHFVLQIWHLDVTCVRKLAFGCRLGQKIGIWGCMGPGLAVMVTLGQLLRSENWHLVMHGSPFGSNVDLGPT